MTFRRDALHDKYWKPLLRRAGLPEIGSHDLRHTCASLLLTKGVHPKMVSEMLGHSSIAITLDRSQQTDTSNRYSKSVLPRIAIADCCVRFVADSFAIHRCVF